MTVFCFLPKKFRRTLNEVGEVQHGVYLLVGHKRQVTKDTCGKFSHFDGCLNHEGHSGVRLDGSDYTGKGYFKTVRQSCFDWGCPECYEAAAAREARKVEARFKEASRLYLSQPEHFVVSRKYVVSDFVDFEYERKQVIKALVARGIFGGCLIFHGFRYAGHEEAERLGVHFGWRWSPHWHVLAYLKGGYRCRSCPKVGYASCSTCVGCHGFEAHTREMYEQDDFVVKVARDREGRVGERISVFYSAFYQLNHSTIRTDAKRAHPLTWWGSMSYRKLHLKIPKFKAVCPICGEKLVRVVHCGYGHLVTDRYAFGYLSEFVDDLYDNYGSPNWTKASDSGSSAWRCRGSHE